MKVKLRITDSMKIPRFRAGEIGSGRVLKYADAESLGGKYHYEVTLPGVTAVEFQGSGISRIIGPRVYYFNLHEVCEIPDEEG